MRRRDLFVFLGGAVSAMPLGVRAQPTQRIRRIGILMPAIPNDPEVQARIGALRSGLQELGWIEGRNYRFEYRWGGSEAERIGAQAVELVAENPDVIVVGSTPGVLRLKQATATIPIVFGNVAEPVANGVVPSLARPGGNITGFLAYEDATAAKWLELLKEIAPRVMRVGYVFGAREQFGPNGELFRNVLEKTAPAFGVQLIPIRIRNAAEIEPSIEALAADPDGGLVVAAEAGAMRNRALIIRAAARHRLPAVYPFRFCAEDGGLAAYGANLNDQYRRISTYVDRIFKGTKPADLPVQAPTKYELIINLKTARALGIEVPPFLQQRADDIIE